MKKKMLLASLFNVTAGSYYTEVLRKCISFLNLFKDTYDFYVLDFEMFSDMDIASNYLSLNGNTEIRSFVNDIAKIIPVKGIVQESIYDHFNVVKEHKNFDEIPFLKFAEKEAFDVIYTFNNYVDPAFNRIASQKKLRFKDIQLLSMYRNPKYFDYMAYRYCTYLFLNESFKKINAAKYELIADPLDLRYVDFTYLLPDIPAAAELNGVHFECFPFYQYYYFLHTKPVKREKEHLLITGCTLYDKWRQELFERYLTDIFRSESNNPAYRWYLAGDAFGKSQNSFIEPEEFNKEIEKSRFGVILNTYAKDIISTNKVSNFISRNCVPVICKGADEKSGFFPEKLLAQLEVKDGDELRSFLMKSNYDELNTTIQREFAYYYTIEYYRSVFSKFF
ncbi:MAG: hypothetical protein JW915_01225 [Chitinispirillaceae bacterium]|nr:hypothetical protein [Chitinispirillaceae bacterium]